MTVVEAPARTPAPKVDKSTDFRHQGRLAATLLSPDDGRPGWSSSATRSWPRSTSRCSPRARAWTPTASSSRATRSSGLGNYTAIFAGDTGVPLLERVLQHHVLHRRLRGHRDRPRRRDGTDHEQGLQGQGADPRQHPRAVGHPDGGLGQAVGLDLRRQRHRQLHPRYPDPVGDRRLAGASSRSSSPTRGRRHRSSGCWCSRACR